MKVAFGILPRWLLIALQVVALVNVSSWYALATHYFPTDTLPWWVTFVAFFASAVCVVAAVALLLTRAVVVRWEARRANR